MMPKVKINEFFVEHLKTIYGIAIPGEAHGLEDLSLVLFSHVLKMDERHLPKRL